MRMGLVSFRHKSVIRITFMEMGAAMRRKKPKPAESLIEASSLSAVDLFQGATPSCLRRVQEMSEVRHYDAGEVFFRHGQPGEGLFFLDKGHVQTFRTTGPRG
jgi:hypothetical protein